MSYTYNPNITKLIYYANIYMIVMSFLLNLDYSTNTLFFEMLNV